MYAILSDIHGNEEAFRNALEYVKGLGIDRILCLGDLVGYGRGAKACVDLVREYNVTCIQGNHDAQVRPPRDPRMREEAAAALDIALAQLDDKDLDWLRDLPTERVVDDRFVLAHGALTHRDDYILKGEDVRKNVALLRERYAGIDLCFFGHTHIAMVVGNGKVVQKIVESNVIPLEPGKPYLVNPGSVGQPRDGVPLSSFAILDPDEGHVMIIRLEYDVKTEQRRMQDAGLPPRLWQRIALGK